MIVILEVNPNPVGSPVNLIAGYIIASDIHEARQAAQSAGLHQLAAILYHIEFPKPGKHPIQDGLKQYIMLVQ